MCPLIPAIQFYNRATHRCVRAQFSCECEIVLKDTPQILHVVCTVFVNEYIDNFNIRRIDFDFSNVAQTRVYVYVCDHKSEPNVFVCARSGENARKYDILR